MKRGAVAAPSSTRPAPALARLPEVRINAAHSSISDSTPQNTFWIHFPRESLMGFVVPKPQAMPHFHPLMQAIYQETLTEQGGFLTRGAQAEAEKQRGLSKTCEKLLPGEPQGQAAESPEFMGHSPDSGFLHCSTTELSYGPDSSCSGGEEEEEDEMGATERKIGSVL